MSPSNSSNSEASAPGHTVTIDARDMKDSILDEETRRGMSPNPSIPDVLDGSSHNSTPTSASSRTTLLPHAPGTPNDYTRHHALPSRIEGQTTQLDKMPETSTSGELQPNGPTEHQLPNPDSKNGVDSKAGPGNLNVSENLSQRNIDDVNGHDNGNVTKEYDMNLRKSPARHTGDIHPSAIPPLYTPINSPLAGTVPISLHGTTPYISFPPGFHPFLRHDRNASGSHSSRDGYVAGNPFQSSIPRVSADDLPTFLEPNIPEKHSHKSRRSIWHIPRFLNNRTVKNDIAIKLDNCLRQVYHSIFLRLPMFYFARVTRVFKEVQLSADDLMETITRELVQQQQSYGKTLANSAYFIDPNAPEVSGLKMLWESFIDSLMREWKTVNIVAILLLTAIVSMLQIDAASSDVVVRNSVLMSLICALMSLLYGAIYTVRFSTMRRLHKAVQWAKEGELSGTAIFWNVWVLLAMPAVWLSWSLILFVIGTMAFVWRTSVVHTEVVSVSPRSELAARICISCVLFIGMVYLALIIRTLKNYGEQMDMAWKEKVREAASASYNVKFMVTPPQPMTMANVHSPQFHIPADPSIPAPPITSPVLPTIPSTPSQHPTSPVNVAYGLQSPQSMQSTAQPVGWLSPSPPRRPPNQSLPQHPPVLFKEAIEVIKFEPNHCIPAQMPQYLYSRGIRDALWRSFLHELSNAWSGLSEWQYSSTTRPQDRVFEVINFCNGHSFNRCHTEAILCREVPTKLPHTPCFVVYLTDLAVSPSSISARFGPIPKGLQRIDIFDNEDPSNPQKTQSIISIVAGDRFKSFDNAIDEDFTPEDAPPTASPSSTTSSSDVELYVDPPTATLNEFDQLAIRYKELVTLDPHSDSLNLMDPSYPNADDLPSSSRVAENNDSGRANTDIGPANKQPTSGRLITQTSRIRPPSLRSPPGSPAPRHHVTFASDLGLFPKSSTSADSSSAPTKYGDATGSAKAPLLEGTDVSSGDSGGYPVTQSRSLLRVLKYQPDAPIRVIYNDLRNNPQLSSCRPCPEADLVRSVTDPSTHEMRLHHPWLPWPIEIVQSHETGITVYDLIFQMWEELKKVVTPSELDSLDQATRNEIMEAHQQRVNMLYTTARGEDLTVKRVDFLKGHVAFEGLVVKEDGVWEIKTKKPEDCNDGGQDTEANG